MSKLMNTEAEKLMDKEAKITGAALDDERMMNAAIPYNSRRKAYVTYLNAKAKEKPSDLLASGGTGALIGGIMGGLVALPHAVKGKAGAVLIGLLIGALGGGLVGLLARAIDKGNIAQAKRILRKGNIDPELADFIHRSAQAKAALKAMKETSRHAETRGRLKRIERKMDNKYASLCEQISGTLNETDFERFNTTFRDPQVRRMIEKNASVMECLDRLTSQPICSTEKLASAAAASFTAGMDVVQVRPNGYGYIIKYSAAPEGMAPQQQQVSAEQAQQSVPPEMLQAADQQGAGTVTNVEAAPDPMSEQMGPAAAFGLYKVTDATTGKQLIGYVIPGVFDPVTGQPSSMSVFTNGSQYAIQPTIMGALVGVNTNLPVPDAPNMRGLGIFVKVNDKGVFATVPYNIITKVDIEGKSYFAAQDTMGNDIRILPSEGIASPVATSPQEIVIPADFKFMPLDNPVQLAGGEEGMKTAQAQSYDTMAEIRAWAGGCKLSGPVFEKVGSGEYDWVDGVFWLAAAGVPQNLSSALLEKAASSGEPTRIFGLRPLSGHAEVIEAANKEAAADMGEIELPKRVNLLKEMAAITFDKKASAMVDIASVDAVLALNFLNPENVETFVENLPHLEDVSTKLASLVLASQLGLQAVPKTAAVRAMFALEDVISGLKSLKTYAV